MNIFSLSFSSALCVVVQPAVSLPTHVKVGMCANQNAAADLGAVAA